MGVASVYVTLFDISPRPSLLIYFVRILVC